MSTPLASKSRALSASEQVSDTIRSPFSCIRSRSWVVTGNRSSAMRHHQCFDLGDLAPPEVAVRQLGVRNGEPPPRLVHGAGAELRSEEHTSELQSRENLVCR